jgi:hypothetical protein
MNELILHHSLLGKQEQSKPKLRKRKTIEIRGEIHEIKTNKTV